jgi:hypothetical protein
MNKRILIAVAVFLLVSSACGINTPAISPPVIKEVDAQVQEVSSYYDEITCPVDTPSGYSDSKCYEISNYSYGSVLYKNNAIKAFGLIIDIEYSDSALDDTADFTRDVVEQAGWDEDDILRVTEKLSNVEIGETVTSGDIKASMDISGSEYVLILYMHR